MLLTPAERRRRETMALAVYSLASELTDTRDPASPYYLDPSAVEGIAFAAMDAFSHALHAASRKIPAHPLRLINA